MQGLKSLALAGPLAAICFGIPAGAPTSSEIAHLTSGDVLEIAQHRFEDDEVILELRDGGEIRFDPALITRIELDLTQQKKIQNDPVSLKVWQDERNAQLLARPYGALIQEASRTYGVNLYLLHAVIEVESQYKASARSPVGAMGLMQLMPELAAQYSVEDPFSPSSNIDAGTRHLRYLIDKFGIVGGLAAYNAGESAVRRYKGVPPFPETQIYVNRVMGLVDENQSD